MRIDLLIFWLIILFNIGLWIYILTWRWRKKEAGGLLLNVGQTTHHKFVFWHATFMCILMLPLVYVCILKFSLIGLRTSEPQNITTSFLETLIFTINSFVTIAGLFYISFTGLEFRKNGICIFLWFVKWERYTSYTWTGSNNSLLYAPYKSRFLILRKFGTIPVPIPAKHRSAVDQVMAKYLPRSSEKN
jgi:hypothetical protein